MAWDEEDAEKAVSEARAALDALLKVGKTKDGVMALCALHAALYMRAGHRKLGRLYVEALKSAGKE